MRAVVITGCSSGIGYALAHGLRKRGYRVFATARNPEDVARLAREGFDAMTLDLASPDSIRTAATWILKRCDGRLWGLVNNGAYGQPGAVEDLARATLRDQFEVNVFGTQELTNLLLPSMRIRGEGRIVQISSLLGYVCLAYRGAYSASKYAIEALSDTLRMELHGSGVHVSLIEPGPIESRFRSNAFRSFSAHITPEGSAHQSYYAAVDQRLREVEKTVFTRPPEVVVCKVLHALSARRPRIRYRVTFPAHLFALLKRLLPDRIMDSLLRRVSGGGRR